MRHKLLIRERKSGESIKIGKTIPYTGNPNIENAKHLHEVAAVIKSLEN